MPDMKHWHLDVLNGNFALIWRGAGKALKVVVPSYFKNRTAPSGTGLSDRTSVELDPPLPHLGQAFLCVSRHRPPPIIFLSPSPSLFPLAMVVGSHGEWVGTQKCVCVRVCVCLHVCVFRCECELRGKSAPGQCTRRRAGQSSPMGPWLGPKHWGGPSDEWLKTLEEKKITTKNKKR